MKGFTKDGKFHPIKPYNKVRKSRDQKVKTQGVVRKQRNVQVKPPRHDSSGWDISLPKDHWDWFTTDGKIRSLESGGLSHIDAVKYGMYYEGAFIDGKRRWGNFDYDELPQRVKNAFRISIATSITDEGFRKARDTLTIQEQRDKFGSEFREKGGDELTEEINRKWENVIVKSTMHKLSKGFAITALDDLIRNFRAFFDDTNWELIAKEKGKIGIIQEIRNIKKSSLLFTGERLKDRFGFGEPDPRPVDKAGKIVQQLFEPFEKMRDEEFGQIKEREADFLMARQIIADATDEIQGESQEQLIRGLKL